MSSKQSQHMINNLADELQHWMRLKMGVDTPSNSDIIKFIENHLNQYNQCIISEQKNEDSKIPALLKKTDSTESKRMRELAGIPHKGNFV